VLLAVLLSAAVAVAVEGGDDEAASAAERRPPIVVIVLDEFPTETLTRPGGEIDARRYPNFAALAETSTWFRNGYTVYDSTFKALPSILDGRMPVPSTAADVRSHQPSVYHMVHELGYDVERVESASAVCPPWICEGTRTRRPGVLPRLAGGGRPARFHGWVGAIRDRPEPTFYFHHALLPHEPWIYLPSGHQSRPPGEDPIKGINKPEGWHDRGLTDHNHLRHLLQVGYTDRELGLVMRRLRRTGLFDRAIFIVMADHGYSFELNVASRRQVTERNIDEIAPVPFFVKVPGQTTGRVDESLVRNIDLVPTLADLLGIPVPEQADGHSAFAPMTRAREHVTLIRRDFSRTVTIGRDEWVRRREQVSRRRAAKYGTGASSERRFGDPWLSAYRIGPNPELLGDRVGDPPPAPGLRRELANAGLLDHVDLDQRLIPTRVVGRILGSPPGAVRDLAVAVNGRIWAVGRSFRLRGRPREFFSLIVPEQALREGDNRLQLLEVEPNGNLRGVRPLSEGG
jgi:arylsulfatase A-like enzyme